MSAGVELVQAQLERLIASTGDPEAAHGIEDNLQRTALYLIRDGAENPGEIARIACLASELDYTRWYS